MKISAIFIFPCIKILWPDFCGFAILSFVGCNLALHYTQLLKWAVTTRCDGNKNFAAIIIQTEGVHLNVILIFISSMQLNATTVYFVEFFIFLPSTLENGISLNNTAVSKYVQMLQYQKWFIACSPCTDFSACLFFPFSLSLPPAELPFLCFNFVCILFFIEYTLNERQFMRSAMGISC